MTMCDEQCKDRLEAMIRQERKFYRCVDYLQVEEPEPVCSPLHVVAELSLLVTDVRATTPQEEDVQRSPTKVNKVPSPTPSWNDLTKFSESSTPTTLSRRRQSVEIEMISSWRHQMLDWAFQVAEIFGVDRDIVPSAFSILDRYLAIKLGGDEDGPISLEEFQLTSMVAMYIAIKNLVPVRKLTVETLIEMSQGFYSPDDITSMERDILSELDWHVNPPTMIDFCRTYMGMFAEPLVEPLANEVDAECQYIAELALDDSYFISKADSSVALATVLLAIQRVGVRSFQTNSFLENLRGLVSIESADFGMTLQRLECLC